MIFSLAAKTVTAKEKNESTRNRVLLDEFSRALPST